MTSNKQDQKVEVGSTAIQAGGDVHYYAGLSVQDVRQLCELFLRENFPRLLEVARQTAEQHVKDFASTLEETLTSNLQRIEASKFAEPDVQAAINDAVQACARKGTAANPTILSKLIVERVAKSSSEFKDVVLSEAIQVVPRLTGEQISFLSLVHLVKSTSPSHAQSIQVLEQSYRCALPAVSHGFDLSDSQKMHAEYAGACATRLVVRMANDGGIYEAARRGVFRHLGFADTSAFKSAVQTHAPSLATILNHWEKSGLDSFVLTSVGEAVAITNLAEHLGPMDYSIWLK
jgi:hypothetical protein